MKSDQHMTRPRDVKRVSDFLRSGGQATISDISKATGVHYHRIASILIRDLEPNGEVWRQGDWWRATVGFLSRVEPEDMEKLRRRLRVELEQMIFGSDPPEWLEEFKAELRAGLKLRDITFDQAWELAQRRVLSGHPELAAIAEAR